MILKVLQKIKEPRIVKILKKKNKAGHHALLDFKFYEAKAITGT